jgi:small subunit ribosomal protein S6
MRNYQLVLVLNSTLSEAARKKLLTTIKEWVSHAKFTKEDAWGEKPLAYTIKRQNSGFFVNWVFEAKDDSLVDLERKLMANDDVLRHLLLRLNPNLKD